MRARSPNLIARHGPLEDPIPLGTSSNVVVYDELTQCEVITLIEMVFLLGQLNPGWCPWKAPKGE